jgi:hypothetical protein
MKKFFLIFIIYSCAGLNSSFAKGCSGGGHGCGHGAVVCASHHNPYSNINKKSFLGYIVYGADTIWGNISVDEDRITVDLGLTTRKFKERDKLIHSVFLSDDDKTLFLTRLKEKDRRFYRLLHKGKLSIYDDKYEFSYRPEDIHVSEMMLAYDGKLRPLEPFISFHNKRNLITIINKVYASNLDYRTMKWKDVYTYVRGLDDPNSPSVGVVQ